MSHMDISTEALPVDGKAKKDLLDKERRQLFTEELSPSCRQKRNKVRNNMIHFRV